MNVDTANRIDRFPAEFDIELAGRETKGGIVSLQIPLE